MIHKRKFTVTALLCACLLSCAGQQTIITSLEDLTSETERQGLSDVNQNRILSITGLLPQVQVGSIYHYKKGRSPSTAIGISRGPSFYVESKIEGPKDSAAIDKVREKILKVRIAAGRALRKKITASKAQALVLEAEQDDSDLSTLDSLIASLEQADREYESARESFDDALNDASLEIKDAGVLVVRWDSTRGKEGGISFGSLFGSDASSESKTSGFAILSGLRLTTLFVGQDIWDVDPNIERTWWFYGDHFPWVLDWKFPFIGHRTIRNVRLTTHVFQTRRVVYLQDMDFSEEFELAVKGSYQDFSRLSDTLEELDSIEINYIESRMASLSNMGVVGETQRRVYPAGFGVPDLKSLAGHDGVDPYLNLACLQITGRSFDAQIKRNETSRLAPTMDEWQTIYTVDTDFEALRERFEKPKRDG